jgi:putative Holliday junction resolvase
MRILAIDHGERNIGLAISDETGLVARPLTVLTHRSANKDAAEIAGLAAREAAAKIVIGLPLDSEGQEGHQARRVRRWAEALQKTSPIPVEFWDESFSTARAAASGSGRKSRRRQRARADDDLAAAAILQEYLDAQREL